MSLSRTIIDWINDNPWRALGALAGFVVGILVLWIGLLNTFLIFLLVVAGFLLGKVKDDNVSIMDSIRNFIDRIRNR